MPHQSVLAIVKRKVNTGALPPSVAEILFSEIQPKALAAGDDEEE